MEDNSFVLQALLDVGADHLLEIIDAVSFGPSLLTGFGNES